MLHKPHGKFSFSRHGDVFFMHFSGVFNEEGAKRRTGQLQAFWRANGEPTRWVALVDIREWQGGTAEAFQEAGRMVQWALTHGMTANACVVANAFLTHLVDYRLQQPPRTAPSAMFEEMGAALDWLDTLNIDTEACRQMLRERQ